MSSITRLVKEVRGCTLCAEHLPLGPRPILQIAPQAPILLAGQAPGSRAHASGIPFDDASGQRLRQWLGISRETFYDPECVAILPMGFCFPGTGKSGDLAPRPECAPTWRQPLLSTLDNLQLTLVLGQYAMKYHLPESHRTVTEAVSDWRRHWPAIVPLPHPSPRNNRWLKTNPWFEEELIPALQTQVRKILDSAQ